VHGKITAIVLFLILARPYAARGQDREPLLGMWRLDFSESTFASGPQAYIRVTCTIGPWQNDGLKVVYDMVGARGGVTHWEWTGRLDGKDYPLEGVEEVITNAYPQVGDRTYSMVFKVDGKVATTSRITVSQDGKTLTVTSPGNTAVYKKR
jgi:hypothetical protein